MRSPTRRGRKALLAVAVLGVSLLVPEIVARFLRLQPVAPSLFLPPSCMRRSAPLGLEFAPNCDGYLRPMHPLRTNAHGLRDREIAADGALRILTMGDSCTYGWSVPPEEAYPQRLERLLAERGGATRYRVINAGIPGYTSYQGLVYLREKGLALDPSILVFGYGFNDSTRLGDVEELLRWQARLLPVFSVDEFLLVRSELWRWLRRLTMPPPPDPDPKQIQRVTPPKFERNLAEMVRLAQARGIKPLMVRFLRCATNQYDAEIAKNCREFGDALTAVSERARVPVVEYDGPLLDVVHPTSEGYEHLARQILASLESNGYLAAPP